MTILVNTVFAIYALSLLLITFYCLMQLNLLYHYKQFHWKKNKAVQPDDSARISDHPLPFVTIQLPIFNEMYVVDRLIDNIMQLDYPKDRFEVHVLDDSNDETINLTKKKVEEYKAQGFQIEQVIRSNRKGFKAGALKDGMPLAKGEFIAIFDADFLPRKDFLRKTLHHFENEKIGVVQTKWEHLNENFSLITRLQALQLNVHFSIEQQGRKSGNYLLQFNGTAGVWRRATIEDAGGWEADTLTEDLDLSIRAQLKGWEIMYLEEVGSPAELPAEMNGLKSQQFRWMKGGAETARKMLPTIWRSQLSFAQKFQASMQLLASTIFVCVFVMGVLSVPALFLFSQLKFGADALSWGLLGMVAFIAVQYVANVQMPAKKGGYWKKLLKFIVLFPLFLALSMGLSLHNTVAVLQGWIGKKTAFIRTPKFNIKDIKDSFRQSNYISTNLSWTTILEGGFCVYFLLAVVFGYEEQNPAFHIMHMLLAIGYGIIFFYTLKHMNLKHTR